MDKELTEQNMSEVAQLREQIECEYAAMQQALHGLATTARHEIITHRFSQIGGYLERLGQLVGKERAVEVVLAVQDGKH